MFRRAYWRDMESRERIGFITLQCWRDRHEELIKYILVSSDGRFCGLPDAAVFPSLFRAH